MVRTSRALVVLSCPLASAVCRREPIRRQRGRGTGARRERGEGWRPVCTSPVGRRWVRARATCDGRLSSLHGDWDVEGRRRRRLVQQATAWATLSAVVAERERGPAALRATCCTTLSRPPSGTKTPWSAAVVHRWRCCMTYPLNTLQSQRQQGQWEKQTCTRAAVAVKSACEVLRTPIRYLAAWPRYLLLP